MSIKEAIIKYDSKNDIINVKTQNKEPSEESILQVFEKVIKICELKTCNNVLLDGSITKKLPTTFDLFSVGEYMTNQLPILSKMRLAYVIPDIISDSFKFFDNVSTNRGAEVHTFKNVTEAKDWLLNKE